MSRAGGRSMVISPRLRRCGRWGSNAGWRAGRRGCGRRAPGWPRRRGDRDWASGCCGSAGTGSPRPGSKGWACGGGAAERGGAGLLPGAGWAGRGCLHGFGATVAVGEPGAGLGRQGAGLGPTVKPGAHSEDEAQGPVPGAKTTYRGRHRRALGSDRERPPPENERGPLNRPLDHSCLRRFTARQVCPVGRAAWFMSATAPEWSGAGPCGCDRARTGTAGWH